MPTRPPPSRSTRMTKCRAWTSVPPPALRGSRAACAAGIAKLLPPRGLARPRALLLGDGHRQTLAALGASTTKDGASTAGLHPGAKPMGALPALVVRLIGSLHGEVSRAVRACGTEIDIRRPPPVKAAIIRAASSEKHAPASASRCRPELWSSPPIARPGFPSPFADAGSRKPRGMRLRRQVASRFTGIRPVSSRTRQGGRPAMIESRIAPFLFVTRERSEIEGFHTHCFLLFHSHFGSASRSAFAGPRCGNHYDSIDVSRPWGQGRRVPQPRAGARASRSVSFVCPEVPFAIPVPALRDRIDNCGNARWKHLIHSCGPACGERRR